MLVLIFSSSSGAFMLFIPEVLFCNDKRARVQ
jgi:hypothetical protein